MQEHIQILQSLDVLSGASDITELTGGRTNHIYLVRMDAARAYVARFAPASNAALGLDRSKEIHNQTLAGEAGVAPRVITYVKEHDLLIVEYVEGETLKPAGAAKSEVIENMARLLAKLHALKGFDGSFDVLKDAEDNYARVKAAGGWLPEGTDKYLELLREKTATMRPVEPAACHFDLMLENIIIGADNGVKLIDWEYAGMGDWRFDLAMYFAKADYGPGEERLFLQHYGAEDSPQLRSELATQKALMNLSIAMYAAAQHQFSGKSGVDYQAYAESEMAALREILGQPA